MRLFSLFYAGPGDSFADYAPFAIYHGTFSNAEKARQAAVALLTADLPEDDEEEPQVQKAIDAMLANPEWTEVQQGSLGGPSEDADGGTWQIVAVNLDDPSSGAHLV